MAFNRREALESTEFPLDKGDHDATGESSLSTGSSRRRYAAAGVALVALLFAVVILSNRETKHDVSGTFTIMEPISEAPGGRCSGEGGYDDIDEGLQVEVRNGKEELLANGSLDSGQSVSLIEATLGPSGKTEIDGKEVDLSGIGDDLDVSYCQFEFTVSGVPKSDFYSISVGRRGDLSYSYKEMVENGWEVAFTLGG